MKKINVIFGLVLVLILIVFSGCGDVDSRAGSTTRLFSSTKPPIVEIGTRYLRDEGGTPGREIKEATVGVGHSFFLEILVRDLRSEPMGVNGLGLNVDWNSDSLEMLDLPFAPGDRDSTILTPEFTGYRSGVFDPTGYWKINKLQALGYPRVGIGSEEAEWFARFRLKAREVADVDFRLQVASIGVGMVNYLRNILKSDIRYAPRPLQIREDYELSEEEEEMPDPPASEEDENEQSEQGDLDPSEESVPPADMVRPAVTGSVWQNSSDPLDVDGDGVIAPRDYLIILNDLNESRPRLLHGVKENDEYYLDVNGDGGVSRLDALLIYNGLTHVAH